MTRYSKKDIEAMERIWVFHNDGESFDDFECRVNECVAKSRKLRIRPVYNRFVKLVDMGVNVQWNDVESFMTGEFQSSGVAVLAFCLFWETESQLTSRELISHMGADAYFTSEILRHLRGLSISCEFISYTDTLGLDTLDIHRN